MFQNEAASMGYRDGFGTTRSVKKVYLWETGEEVGRSLPGRVRGGRRVNGGAHHPLATNTPPSSSSPSPPSSSPSPPTTPPPCSYIYRTWASLDTTQHDGSKDVAIQCSVQMLMISIGFLYINNFKGLNELELTITGWILPVFNHIYRVVEAWNTLIFCLLNYIVVI